MEIVTTIIIAGAAVLQYLPHPIGYPFFAATDVPTTFADAPIGVALPPMSVPIDSVHARQSSNGWFVPARLLMIGSIVAANGMLSTNALAIAEI